MFFNTWKDQGGQSVIFTVRVDITNSSGTIQENILNVQRTFSTNNDSTNMEQYTASSVAEKTLSNQRLRISITRDSGNRPLGFGWDADSNSTRLVIPGEPAVLAVDMVDSGGNPVSSPSVSLSSVDSGFACQTSTGTLGTFSQRIRVTNTTANGNWTLSIAATDGSSALWSNGTDSYDFNDPSGSPPGCDNGQLTVDTADNGTITPQGGCASTGISKGNAAFSQGVTNSVTLLSASGSQTGCYFDLMNINLSQKIPPEVPSSATPYTINMTLTLIAN